MSLGDLIKTIAPVVAGAYLGPVGGAVATGLGSVALGENPKDALRAALLSGLGGVGAQNFFLLNKLRNLQQPQAVLWLKGQTLEWQIS